MSVEFNPLTGAIGASVEGVRLDRPLEKKVLDQLKEAFLERSLLVFRDQHIDPASHVAFAKLWGDPVVTAMLKPLDGHPEIVQITDIPKATSSTEAWHYDAPFTQVPPKISILSGLIVPPGGDTMWSSQYLAYERLSPALQAALGSLRVRFRGSKLGRMLNVDEADIPEATHPLVRTHPETGRKALYVSHLENLLNIEGWTRAESEPLLRYLYEHSIQPDNTYRHVWSPGDVVMWDNRCTMHYAVHDYGDQKRVLNRVTLHGEVPA